VISYIININAINYFFFFWFFADYSFVFASFLALGGAVDVADEDVADEDEDGGEGGRMRGQRRREAERGGWLTFFATLFVATATAAAARRACRCRGLGAQLAVPLGDAQPVKEGC
jgi:hypothetical protein